MKVDRVTILGAGAWGCALACAMHRAGHFVQIWTKNSRLVEDIACGKNEKYLPGIPLPKGIFATCDPTIAFKETDCILVAIPAQYLREVLTSLSFAIPSNIALMICSKGIEQKTGFLLSDVAIELFPTNDIGFLSGPSFACDVAQALPTAVVIATQKAELSKNLACQLSSDSFRCYSSTDLIGVGIAGALKNVFAIASGIVIGAGLGESARASMITRGFLEMQRIACSFGGHPETMKGLSGLGDLFLTCSSQQSRNFSWGMMFARGEAAGVNFLVEGVPTASIMAKIAQEKGLDTPLLFAIASILERSITIKEVLSLLMNRPICDETR